MNYKTSDKGKNLIMQYEGCSLKAYKDSTGVWTIGYGHTGGVAEGEVITKERAYYLLAMDLNRKEDYVNRRIGSFIDLKQNEFDALVSFAYNLGSIKDSFFECLVNNDFVAAVEVMLLYRNAGKKYHLGLHRRRVAEAILFTGFEVNTATLSDIRNRYTEIELLEFSKNLINWYEAQVKIKELARL